MEKRNAIILSTSTKYNINMGKSNEEQKEVVHSDDDVDEVPSLYSEESEELEEDPEEESYEEDPEEESYEEDPEEESNGELDDDPEEESNEGLEDDPEGKSNEEPEEESNEDPVEESNGESEEDPEEESSDELEEEPSSEVGPEEEELEEESSSEVGPEEEEHGEEPADPPKEKPCMEHCKSLSNHNDSRTEDLLEVCLSKHRDTDKSEYLLAVAPIANNSNDKKRTMHVTAADSTPLQDCHSRKKYKQDKSPELKAECSSATSDKDECASQQEKTGSSGKRRRSRWDLQPERDGKTGEDGKTSKRRKTRWVTDDSLSKMLGPLQLPDFKKVCVLDYELNSEFQELKAKILEINQLLQKPELQNQNPVYDHLRTKLIDERQRIISTLIKKNSTFQPPDDKPSKFCKKLYIPVNEYPRYNFTGRIVGHRGNTVKMMEKETGAKILLRGKGCMTLEKSPSVNEDLHVYIEADNRNSMDAAVAMVEKLLIPIDEGKNAKERTQLEEPPKLNGTSIKEKALERSRLKKNACKVCGEKGHHDYACPDQQSTFKTTVSCRTCGCNSHLTATCPLPSYSPLSNSIKGTKIKPSNEIDEANLYVGYLPSLMDEHRLKELFCPFGKLTEARVIKDRTTGISKGYGFVKFENASDAAVAIAHLDDYVMDGKMLAVRVAGQPSVADSRVKQYHAPLPNVKSQGTRPGSLLPEQASCLGPTMLSPSIYSGHRDLPPQTKAFDWTPSSSSPYRFSVFSSPTALFPSGTDLPGSQFQSCFMTPSSALHLGHTPGTGSGLDSICWPGDRGTQYDPLCNQHK